MNLPHKIFRHSLWLFATLICFEIKAQTDTVIYFSREGEWLRNKENASTCVKTSKSNDGLWLIQSFYKEKKKWILSSKQTCAFDSDTSYLIMSGQYPMVTDTVGKRIFRKEKYGYLISEFTNGAIEMQGISNLILPVIKDGLWTYYL
jgi:hypothetical protein